MDEVPPILVVVDEPLVRLVIVEALQEGGYTVLEATQGLAALTEIDRSENLRGLVTDIRMGATPSGWEVAQHAREKFPTVAVVFVTGDSISEWPANGVPRSAVLQKPFASAELVTALANFVGGAAIYAPAVVSPLSTLWTSQPNVR
jgi:CheY-like chemotaxis protein